MKKIVQLFFCLGILWGANGSAVSGCAVAAKLSVELIDYEVRLHVDSVREIYPTDFAAIDYVVAKMYERGPRALGLLPTQMHHLLRVFMSHDPAYKFYLVYVGRKEFFVGVDSASCSSYRPIFLGKI